MIMMMVLFLLLVIQHEVNVHKSPETFQKSKHIGMKKAKPNPTILEKAKPPKVVGTKEVKKEKKKEKPHYQGIHTKENNSEHELHDTSHNIKSSVLNDVKNERGFLTCDGEKVDSEVIYWKIVPGDNSYESPITPHHGMHHDKYLSFEYDGGGWNNVRMAMVSAILILAYLTVEHDDEYHLSIIISRNVTLLWPMRWVAH